MLERLQKIIAGAGLASRRAAETLITDGQVRVNGKVVTELGAKADPRKDKIEVRGRRLMAAEPVYIVMHKPRDVVCTLSDPEGRPTVADFFKHMTRIYPVGRLDFATSGVLLLTNDGEFSNALLHPKKKVPKTYVLKVARKMTEEDLERWAEGVELEDGKTLPAQVMFDRHEGDKTWFSITIREGRNQQLRRMGEATGFRVMRLARVSFAGITTDKLRPGQWRPLRKEELLALRKAYGVPKRVRAAVAAATAMSTGDIPAPVQRGGPANRRPRPGQGKSDKKRGAKAGPAPTTHVERERDDKPQRPRGTKPGAAGRSRAESGGATGRAKPAPGKGPPRSRSTSTVSRPPGQAPGRRRAKKP